MSSELTDITISRTIGPEERRSAGPTAPYLVLALQCDRPQAPAARFSLSDCRQVRIGRSRRADGRLTMDGAKPVLAVGVADGRMSSRHAVMTRSGDGWLLEDEDSKNGTFVNGMRRSQVRLTDGDVVELGHTFFLYREMAPEPDGMTMVSATQLTPPAPTLATLNPGLARRFSELQAVAESRSSVVILGESGTGKELAARAVHQLSGRSGALIAVNCGALPDNLVEAELFGYRKGAFSGAAEDRLGLIRSADRGTLLLDEIGDLPQLAQAAFLRVLQEREVVPVGATQPVPVDFRVVAATHRDLETMVATGRFRDDLYARLQAFEIHLPPLRARREDLGILVAALLRRIERGTEARFSFEAARALFLYDWPRNIRELEKYLGTAVALARGGSITLEHLPEEVTGALSQPVAAVGPLAPGDEQLREELCALLRRHAGNVTAVGRAMGKSRVQIHRWIKRFGIDVDAFRDG